MCSLTSLLFLSTQPRWYIWKIFLNSNPHYGNILFKKPWRFLMKLKIYWYLQGLYGLIPDYFFSCLTSSWELYFSQTELFAISKCMFSLASALCVHWFSPTHPSPGPLCGYFFWLQQQITFSQENALLHPHFLPTFSFIMALSNWVVIQRSHG